MPIRKFKTLEEADRAISITYHPDEAYFKRVAALWNFADKLDPVSWPRGIFKFKTIEEANKHREEIEKAHAQKKRVEKNVL
jgi:hypothetical protein